ncbi:UNVERIFIED_CONTAM: hypothetical protein ABID98_004399 [Brevibacillus sp. OAP136]
MGCSRFVHQRALAKASALTWSLCECAGQGLAAMPNAGLSAKPAWHISPLHLKAEASTPLRSMLVSAALISLLAGLTPPFLKAFSQDKFELLWI